MRSYVNLISLSSRIFSTFSSSVFRLTVSNAFYMSIINIIRLKFSDVIAFSISSFMHITLFSCVSSFLVGCLIFWYMIFQFFPCSFYYEYSRKISQQLAAGWMVLNYSLEVFVVVYECLLSRCLDSQHFSSIYRRLSDVSLYAMYSTYMLYIPGLWPFFNFLDAILMISSSVKGFFILQRGYSLEVRWLSLRNISLKKLVASSVCRSLLLTISPFPL